MSKELIKVLLVEGNVVDVRLVKRILAKSSEPVEFAVESVSSLSDAIECLTNREYDIVLFDLGLSDSSGIETVQKFKRVIPNTPLVVLTGTSDEETGLLAIRNGAADYLVKDLPLNILLARTIIYALERKKASEALAQSESKFRTLVEHLPKKIFIKDKNSVYLFSNHNYAQDLKIKPEEITGKTDYDFYPKELAEKYRADDKRIMETGVTEDIEEKYIENGEERWVHTIKTPYKDAKGNIIGVLGIFRDITESKKKEKLLFDSNRRLQETSQELLNAKQELEKKNRALGKAREELERQVEKRTVELVKANKTLQAAEANLHKVIVTSPDGIVIVNKDGTVQFVNPAAESLFNRKAKELVGELFGFPVTGGKVIEIDIVNHGAGLGIAEMRTVETEWNGQKAYLALLRDVTDRKQAEEKIKQAAKQWRTTFDSITEMVSIHDKHFKISRVNKALADVFQTEPKELIGKTCYEVFHCSKKPYSNCPHEQSLKTGKPATLELYEPNMGIHLDISTSPILDDKGEITACVHIAKDITERKLAEEKLKEANERLKDFNQLKDEFISTASHELRTPLSVIMGAIRLILDEIPGKIVDKQREVLSLAKDNVQKLSRIVDSLLSISKIESGRLELQKAIINICDLIKSTVSVYQPLAQDKGIHLDCEVPEECVNICIDQDKIEEVLINLISNSLKFTPEGGRVRVTCTKQGDEVLVSVQDSGVGIAEENIPKLFDKFTQFGRKTGPEEKGTGLGLTIAKKLVQIHGGRIEIESKVNQGTTFTIILPSTTEVEAEDLPTETEELVENTLTNS